MTTLDGANIHALIIADCYSKDIRAGGYKDLINMHKEIQKVAKAGGYGLNIVCLDCQTDCVHKVLKFLKDLDPHSDDIVIFYFSGHGYRKEDSSKWPCLSFAFERRGMDFKEIRQWIASKKARLSLLIADCCNWQPSYGNLPSLFKMKGITAKVSKDVIQNYDNLFGQTAGLIVIASSKAGQPSFSSLKGSLYTLSFLRSLQEKTESHARCEWQEVLDLTQFHLKNLLKPHKLIQTPIVKLKLK